MVDVYRTEEEQVEAVKQWWRENGKSIIAGIAIGLTAIFGWRGWQNHTVIQAESASTLYQQMISASRNNNSEEVRVYAERITDDHQSTTYGTFATLMLAKLAAEGNDLAAAETHLRWVLANDSQAEIGHIARLRLARVLIADNKLEQALDTLSVSDKGKFVTRYEELRGDIFIQQGKNDEARQAYQTALANIDSASEAQSILQMKLDELGRI